MDSPRAAKGGHGDTKLFGERREQIVRAATRLLRAFALNHHCCGGGLS